MLLEVTGPIEGVVGRDQRVAIGVVLHEPVPPEQLLHLILNEMAPVRVRGRSWTTKAIGVKFLESGKDHTTWVLSYTVHPDPEPCPGPGAMRSYGDKYG